MNGNVPPLSLLQGAAEIGPQTAPARKRTVLYNHSLTVEELPEGGRAIVVRLDNPYERIDITVDDAALRGLSRRIDSLVTPS